MPNLEIHHLSEDGTEILSVSGELDLATHAELRGAIRELLMSGPAEIVVDLSETTFIDSVALGTLIGARRRTYGLRGGLAVIIGDGQVARVFELTGLDKVFTTYGSLEEWRAS